MGHSRMNYPLAHGEHKPYGKTPYREIRGPNGKLAKREAFKGSSMRAEWETNYLYVVRSYDQIVAQWFAFAPEGSRLEIDPFDLYGHSQTTSTHINLCKAWMRE